MTAAGSQKEVDDLTTAYSLAVSRLGIRATVDALQLWEQVPPGATPAAATSWLRKMISLLMGHRAESVALGRSFYRLERALLTGHTIADPTKGETASTDLTLGELRQEFNALAKAQDAGGQSAQVDTQGLGPEAPEIDDSAAKDSDRIIVEEIARLQQLEAQAEAAVQQEIALNLAALGPDDQAKRLKLIDHGQPASDVVAQRQQAHDQSGARQASAAGRIAMNGARQTTWLHQQNDKRAIGYVRVSLTGTPCGWCAMLISRGPVYRSAASATLSSGAAAYDDGNKYHDNCHCIAVPVFSKEQFDSSAMFALNRKYGELWPQVTQGLGGSSAVSAWRRFIRTEQAKPAA